MILEATIAARVLVQRYRTHRIASTRHCRLSSRLVLNRRFNFATALRRAAFGIAIVCTTQFDYLSRNRFFHNADTLNDVGVSQANLFIWRQTEEPLWRRFAKIVLLDI